MQLDLAPLLSPKSVAIIGASNNPTRIGGRPIRYYKEAGFAGDIYPINPGRPEIQGLPAFTTLEALPAAPDLCIIARPASEVESLVTACADQGAKAVIVFSSGFAELGADGLVAQQALGQLARDKGLALLGPNCLGVVDAQARNTATFGSFLEAAPPSAGSVAVISQSGAFGTHLYTQLKARRANPGLWITTGNEAGVTIADGTAFAAQRDDVSTILLYAESIRSGDTLCDAVTAARNAAKAVAILKVGITQSGQAAAASHTAALANDTAVTRALLTDAGAHWCETTQDLLDFAYAVARAEPLKGNRLGIFTVSGGAGILMADVASTSGLMVPELPDPVQAEIKANNPHASTANPVDVTAQAFNEPDLIKSGFDALTTGGACDAISAFLLGWPDAPDRGPAIRAALEEAAGRPDRVPTAICATVGEETRSDLEAHGYLVFDDASRAVSCLGMLGQALTPPRQPAEAVALPARPLLTQSAYDEDAASAWVNAIGIESPSRRIVRSKAEAEKAASMATSAVAMKIVSADIAHKSDMGGVKLGVTGAAQAGDAYEAIMAAANTNAPRANVDGVLVTDMAPDGVDLLVGVRRDPAFGPVLTVGLGGIYTEIFKDVAFARCPVSEEDARGMLLALKGAALLRGARGGAPSDIGAAAKAIARLSSAAISAADFADIEINPLRVFPEGQGAWALDALIVTPEAREPLWLAQDFREGASLGQTAHAIDAQTLEDFNAATGQNHSAVSIGLITALMLRSYMRVLPQRPAGNVHAGMRFDRSGPLPDLGDTLEVAWRCTGKTTRKGRPWISLTAQLGRSGDPFLTCYHEFVWAQ